MNSITLTHFQGAQPESPAENSSAPPSRRTRLGFSSRLTLMIVSLVLISVMLVAGLVYVQYRQSFTQATIQQLQGTGEMMAGSFTQWLDARQDEISFVAGLDPVRQIEVEPLQHLLTRLAEQNGYYDTIFFVGPDGGGVAGVSFDGHATLMTSGEAAEFQVADRAWFREAIQGREVFSQPLVSRATGNQVSNVVAPVFADSGEVVGVVRAAVRLDVLFERMAEMSLGGSSDTYLLGADGMPVTPVAALEGESRELATEAASAIGAGESGVGRYRDVVGSEVIGSYTYLPLLNWGLVVEVPEREALAEVSRLFWILVGITALIVSIAVLVSLGVVRSVVRVLGGDPQRAAEVVRRVVQGDLTMRVPVRAGDNASLMAHMHEMQQNLQSMMGDIRRTAESVSVASSEIAQGNEDLASRTEEQSSSLVETASSLEQMTATVRQTADSSTQARELTAELDEQTRNASGVGQEAAQSMGAIKQANKRVESIVEAIDGIAFQTNLLALNASVEAARAGDHGRGFAVVATEVRQLAGRCAAEANKIRELVDSSVASVDEGERLVNTASEQLATIAEGVGRVSGFISEIATAATEQSSGIEQISMAVSQLDEVTQQNAALVQEATAAGQSLRDQAREMARLVQRFKVEEGSADYRMQT
ncbi:methyl-accepting chemotaxis protein [Billgrantia kenyensis]|uniref:Methyl-accepting chemotaxis protein n=1 Tax=Billgrantia kenyensis TaxID=321266 RepID=A0A7V9W574_9GAMM|nr:methyl-accepting chemotaxis protein [Halomonas kenyensis]MBA2781259.1 methyl-accepting chemotaxis protein [Halomonas kenyensis]MCG6662778.1 methyl-accepting chemotaxis protein [Halomonas kenyensis]